MTLRVAGGSLFVWGGVAASIAIALAVAGAVFIGLSVVAEPVAAVTVLWAILACLLNVVGLASAIAAVTIRKAAAGILAVRGLAFAIATVAVLFERRGAGLARRLPG